MVQTGDKDLVKEYFERIIYHDILRKNDLQYPEALRTMALYLLSSIGKEFSYNSLKSIGKIRHENTIKKYTGALRDAYLLDVLTKYSPSVKTQETYNKKIYSVDPLFSGLGGRTDDDKGRILENIVFLHLKRVDDLYFVKNRKEADFLLCNGLKPSKLVNVTFEAEDKKTLERETASLEYFGRKFRVPVEVPDDVKSRLAHRYLSEAP